MAGTEKGGVAGATSRVGEFGDGQFLDLGQAEGGGVGYQRLPREVVGPAEQLAPVVAAEGNGGPGVARQLEGFGMRQGSGRSMRSLSSVR